MYVYVCVYILYTATIATYIQGFFISDREHGHFLKSTRDIFGPPPPHLEPQWWARAGSARGGGGGAGGRG